MRSRPKNNNWESLVTSQGMILCFICLESEVTSLIYDTQLRQIMASERRDAYFMQDNKSLM